MKKITKVREILPGLLFIPGHLFSWDKELIYLLFTKYPVHIKEVKDSYLKIIRIGTEREEEVPIRVIHSIGVYQKKSKKLYRVDITDTDTMNFLLLHINKTKKDENEEENKISHGCGNCKEKCKKNYILDKRIYLTEFSSG